MTEFVVIERRSDGSSSGMGAHSFKVVPRIGEYITANDEFGEGQAYQVIAVIHPLKPASTAGDLVVRHVSSDVDLRKSL